MHTISRAAIEALAAARSRLEAGRTVLHWDGPPSLGSGLPAVDRRGEAFHEYTHSGLISEGDGTLPYLDWSGSVSKWERTLDLAILTADADTIEWRIEPEIAFEGGGWKVYSRLSFWKASDPK